jgi:HlyD family secretion protein
MLARKFSVPTATLTLAGIVLAACAAGARGSASVAKTAQVTTITATTSVETSGTVQPLQSATLLWKTTGQVATVTVKAGAPVIAGDVLMTLDPSSAPQSVIQAQAELLSAQKALNDLLEPGVLTIASAHKAVADAQSALETAQRDLRYAQNPVGQNLYDTVRDAEVALNTAKANAQLSNVSQDVQDYNGNVWIADWYFKQAQDAQANLDADPGNQRLQEAATKAWSDYQAQADKQAQRQLRIQVDKENKGNVVAQAQTAYDKAVANLQYAQQGPDALRLAQRQADVAVAEAKLADAQKRLADLLNGGNPDDVAAARARVQAAQAAVGVLVITAPFDGEVLEVNYLPGDLAAQNTAAVVLANRTTLHVEVPVDEADIADIVVGDEVQVTFDPLAGLALDGAVTEINPVGQTQQGLVKYTVRVDVTETDPRVLLGMTANVNIITDVQANALAVPIEAVQLDDQGEYVNRVRADGTVERVSVTSGQTQDDVVVVTGALSPGDVVQIPAPQPDQFNGPFGG